MCAPPCRPPDLSSRLNECRAGSVRVRDSKRDVTDGPNSAPRPGDPGYLGPLFGDACSGTPVASFCAPSAAGITRPIRAICGGSNERKTGVRRPP